MIEPRLLIACFDRNYVMIKRETEGLTHEDSLLQPPFRGNCLNWVVGHLVSARSGVMIRLGIEPVWTDEQRVPYRNSSPAITAENADTAYPLETILRDLDYSQDRLLEALSQKTFEDMFVPIKDMQQHPLGQSLLYSGTHESYHTGQLELLRQLAGKDDQVPWYAGKS